MNYDLKVKPTNLIKVFRFDKLPKNTELGRYCCVKDILYIYIEKWGWLQTEIDEGFLATHYIEDNMMGEEYELE
jgi:hypothetical protein